MHYIIDIETLGKSAGSALLSVAAVAVDDSLQTQEIFYEMISLRSAMNYGSVEPDTLQWWMSQNAEARDEAFSGEEVTGGVLARLASWMRDLSGGASRSQVWGYGADFDNANLLDKYSKLGYEPGWTYKGNRCLRTLLALCPDAKDITPEMQGTAHNAKDDAIYQAALFRSAMNLIRGVA